MRKLTPKERAWLIPAAAQRFDELMVSVCRWPYAYVLDGAPYVVQLEPFNCLFNSRALCDIYRHFQIPARPMAVGIDVGNEGYCRCYWSKNPPGPPDSNAEIDEWVAHEAFSVWVGPFPDGARPRRFNGHLVLIADNSYYVDPSLQQASRPDRGIVITEPLVHPLAPDDPLLRGEPSVVTRPTGLPIPVFPMPDARDYNGALFDETGGWNNPCIPDIVTKVTEKLTRDLLKIRKQESR